MIWQFLTSNIAQIGGAVLAILGAIIYAFSAGRKGGRNATENEQFRDTQDRLEKGRKALRDGRDSGDSPADRLRKNDGKF